MKRRLTKLVVFLLFGAVVNVAVAWGCALWSKIDWTWGTDRWSKAAVPLMESRVVQPLSDHEIIDGVLNTCYGFGRRCDRSVALGRRTYYDPASYKLSSLRVYYEGWPLKTATWECFTGPGDYGSEINFAFRPPPLFDRSIPGVDGDLPRALPLRPIWGGLTINTIFYAPILWLPFAPFVLRRSIRRKRGHCIQCGYDLRGTSGGNSGGSCSECGWQGESEA